MTMSDEHDDDLAALRGVAADLRRDELTLELPPDDLWARIETAVEDDARAADASAPDAQAPDADTGAPHRDAMVTPIGRAGRRPGPVWRLVGAAAAVVVVVAAAVLIFGNGSEPDVVASTTLDLLGDQGSGQVELIYDDGSYRLQLETADLDADDGFLEVWVIDRDVTRLVSLGPLRADGSYELPPGVDPAAFPVVDISVEPIDGDPTHSGNSVLRGVLEF